MQLTSLHKKILKIVISVILLVVLILIFINLNKSNVSESDGNIVIIVNNINNEIVSTQRISFKDGDTLFNLLNEHYNLTYKDELYGHYLTGIATDEFSIQTEGDTTGWLWFELFYLKEGMEYNQNIDFENYVKQEVHVGIDGIELKDEMIFGINQRDNNHETSIHNQNIDVTNKLNNFIKNIFLVIIIILAILFIISIIIYIIKNKKNNNQQMSIKQITIIASMATILFVQEQLLTFIPNVQLTFLLISLYTVVFGFKKTSLIIFIHILLDNIVMGSFNPIVMLPMYIGYELCSLLVHSVRKKNTVIITIMASIGSIIYCLAFMIANAFFLNIDILAYYVADIPFEIILVISTILSVMYLFRPLEKILRKQWESI